MAAAKVEKAYAERDETIDADGNVTEIAIHYLVFDAAVLAEFYARNPWMDVADGLTFEESERVNYDLKSGLVVKSGAPDSVPLGEVVLFVPATDGRGAFAAIFTDEKFYREYTLTGKDKPQC